MLLLLSLLLLAVLHLLLHPLHALAQRLLPLHLAQQLALGGEVEEQGAIGAALAVRGPRRRNLKPLPLQVHKRLLRGKHGSLAALLALQRGCRERDSSQVRSGRVGWDQVGSRRGCQQRWAAAGS